jgi:hypothetical protein
MNSILGRLKTEVWPEVWPFAKSHLIRMVRNMAADFAAGGDKAR